ncbi:MAG: YqgE/AlgH family protein [Planctomycetota bacterium]|nr:YqgE/AlgH family protein [Planctomycetota bacterium]
MVHSLTGQLLVASSLVTDPMYTGGVCLIVHHDENDLIGVMLNRPLKPTPEAIDMMIGESSHQKKSAFDAKESLVSRTRKPGNQRTESRSQADNDLGNPTPWNVLHFGGPLSGPVVAVHPIRQYGDVETGQGIYLAAQKHLLEHLVREHEGPCRLIVGHLGWEIDQLREEMDQGYWHILPATAETVFSPAPEMWPRIIRQATSGSLARWIGVKEIPQAADLN